MYLYLRPKWEKKLICLDIKRIYIDDMLMTVTLVEKATTRRINDPSISDPISARPRRPALDTRARPAGDCPGRETDAVQLLFCISFSDLFVSTRSGVVIVFKDARAALEIASRDVARASRVTRAPSPTPLLSCALIERTFNFA